MSADWTLYRSFAAVVRAGSLSAAARQLGLTQPTVGRHIDALEQALGTALFTRAPQGLLPTDTALDLLPHAQAMEAAAAALERAASGESEQPRGAVRLAASEVVGSEVLPAMLTRFHERFPEVAVELVTSSRMSNLLTREADLAVRMARPEQGALVAQRVGEVPIRLYAHRDYAARHGLPESVAQLPSHTAVGFDADLPMLQTLARSGLPLTRESFGFRSDDQLAQLAALRAGFGIGGVQVAVAQGDRRLLPVLPQLTLMKLEVWLVMHRDLRAVRRLRLLFDHLREELTAFYGGGAE